jgi:hypothetical protein
MAIPAWQTKILIDQYDFSGQTNGVTIEIPVGVLEYMVLQTTAAKKLPSFPTPNIVHGGFYDGPASGQMYDAFDDRLGSANDVTVGVILGTSETIPVGYVLPTSWGQQLKIAAPANGLITLSGAWPSGTSRLYRGYQAFYGTISATGAQTGIDFSVAGSAGGIAYLFVQAVTGSASSATIKVQSDSASNFATAADEGTFTFSAVGAFSLALSGAVNRYVRLNCTSLGGATNFTVLAVVCLDGVTF